MAKEPVAKGVVVVLAERHREPLVALQKESLSMLRALDAEAATSASVPPDADFVVLLVDPFAAADKLALPELKDRAATVLGVGDDAPDTRAAIARARKALRQQAAALSSRELALRPEDFGILGLESDGLREKLEILLRTLVNDAERLRLRREGWEEPDSKLFDGF